VKILELFLFLALFVFCGIVFIGFPAMVIDAAYHHYQEHHVSDPPKDTRPAIPDCSKPTWERITQGCDDEGHD
jgi:hypothetical protein